MPLPQKQSVPAHCWPVNEPESNSLSVATRKPKLHSIRAKTKSHNNITASTFSLSLNCILTSLQAYSSSAISIPTRPATTVLLPMNITCCTEFAQHVLSHTQASTLAGNEQSYCLCGKVSMQSTARPDMLLVCCLQCSYLV